MMVIEEIKSLNRILKDIHIFKTDSCFISKSHFIPSIVFVMFLPTIAVYLYSFTQVNFVKSLLTFLL